MIFLKNGEGIRWPHGKRIAVMLTFDFDAELLRQSVIGKKEIGFSDRSRGLYGPHEGLARCLAMLKRQELRSTFFVPGKIVEEYPEEVHAIAEAGHELAYHGYDHDARIGIPEAEEEANMEKSEKLLQSVNGETVAGYRAPLDGMQEYSLVLLQKRKYLYSSTLKDCDWAYVHATDGMEQPIVELPTEPGIDDFSYFYFSYADEKTITCTYPSDYVYDIWKDYFDELASEGDKVMVLKLHPQLIGRVSRIRMLERLVLYMKQNGAWITTCREAAQYVLNDWKQRKGGEQ